LDVIARELINMYPDRFVAGDFQHNKEKVAELADFDSRVLRKRVAGYITRILATQKLKRRSIVMKHDIKKKQKSWLRKLSCSSPAPVKTDEARISISSLRKLVTTKEHEDILKLIENETIPSVRAAWIDYFLEKTKLSKCKKSD